MPTAVGLRMAMQDCWHLPKKVKFSYRGPDWLLLLLDQCTKEERDLTKLLLANHQLSTVIRFVAKNYIYP